MTIPPNLTPVFQAVRQNDGSLVVYEVYYKDEKPTMISKRPVTLNAPDGDIKTLLVFLSKVFLDCKTAGVLEMKHSPKGGKAAGSATDPAQNTQNAQNS